MCRQRERKIQCFVLEKKQSLRSVSGVSMTEALRKQLSLVFVKHFKYFLLTDMAGSMKLTYQVGLLIEKSVLIYECKETQCTGALRVSKNLNFRRHANEENWDCVSLRRGWCTGNRIIFVALNMVTSVNFSEWWRGKKLFKPQTEF